MSIDYGKEITNVPTPTRMGCTFVRWEYYDNDELKSFDFDQPITENDVQLYAKWQPASGYSLVTFKPNGGDGTEYTQLFKNGEAQYLIENSFQYAEHVFVGWNTKSTGDGYGYANYASFTCNANTTLYAQWAKEDFNTPSNYKAVYHINNESGIPNVITEGYNVHSLTYTLQGLNEIFPSYTIPEDKQFKGWSLSADGEGVRFKAGDQITLSTNPTETKVYAIWEDKTYNVTVNVDPANGGRATASVLNDDGNDMPAGTAPKAGNTIKLTATPAEGYKFVKWETRDVDSINGDTNATFSMPAQNVTVTALFELKKYMVAFDANGGTLAPETATPLSIKHGYYIEQPDDPTHGEYTFMGWYTAQSGGTLFDFEMPITSAITLYAHWTDKPIAITFDPNYEGFTGEKAMQIVAANSKEKLKKNEYTREGYEFVGWTLADDRGTLFDDEAEYAFGNDALTFYAQWRSLNPTPSTDDPTHTDVPTPTPAPIAPTLPKTGDSTPLSLWLALAALSGMGMAAALRCTRKGRKE